MNQHKENKHKELQIPVQLHSSDLVDGDMVGWLAGPECCNGGIRTLWEGHVGRTRR